MKKAFIEYDFPIKEVSEQSVREKSLRQGLLPTLHTWWARRPLAATRATIYASLIPAMNNDDERKLQFDFISEFANWDNCNRSNYIEKARKEIIKSYKGKRPKVLDPFGGGGSIPFEALRLGCEVFTGDLNPVAVLIQKASLEYQKYNRLINQKDFLKERPWICEDNSQLNLYGSKINPLVEDLKYWSDIIYKKALNKLHKYYTDDQNNLSDIVGYIWARKIKCFNPKCGVDIPLIRQTWLRKLKGNDVAFKIVPENDKIRLKICVGKEIDFDPSIGTVNRAKVVCPCCGSTKKSNETKDQIIENGGQGLPLVVIRKSKDGRGKIYDVVTKDDIDRLNNIEIELENLKRELKERWLLEPIPDEPIPDGRGSGAERAFGLKSYGLDSWGQIFNKRQKLMLLTFCSILQKTFDEMETLYRDHQYKNVIITYLVFQFDRILGYGSTLCILNPHGSSRMSHTFSRPTLSFTWDYMEGNPFYETAAGWKTAYEKNKKFIEINTGIFDSKVNIMQESATNLSLEDNSMDAVFTDPPYYDNIPYSGLSDFFYVWQKRLLKDIFPYLYFTPLTPKTNEVVAYSKQDGGLKAGKLFYEEMLYKSFCEINRVLKPEGIAYIVYAHKSVDAWETIINSLLKSGMIFTASWPINTERKGRLRSKDSAALASSIYMVCRKRNTNKTAYYNEIKPAIEKRIHEKLDQFWAEGIGGSDFFISAIGPAVEVFGKYQNVEKLSGEKVSVKELLEYVRQIVSEYALSKILKSPQLGGIDNTTRFYLIWRFTYGNAKVVFDDASKLARAIGFDIEANCDSAGLVNKQKEWISIKGPIERRNDELFERRIAKHFPAIAQETIFDDEFIAEPPSMIDVLHQCLIFWGRNNRLTIAKLLEGSGYRNNNHFWQVAQSISDILPDGDKEKQLIQGFLYGKEGYQSGKIPVDIPVQQENLFEEGQ